jgi:hypothetical protein
VTSTDRRYSVSHRYIAYVRIGDVLFRVWSTDYGASVGAGSWPIGSPWVDEVHKAMDRLIRLY